MITGNKGEWSEVYTLFKLLADGKLYTGDGKLNKLETLFFPIIKIIRHESGVNFEYELKGDIVLINNGSELSVPITEFRKMSFELLSKIRSEKGSFGSPEIESFMRSYGSSTLKAKSTHKTDIRILIHDIRINQIADLGFSVKSELGNDSTLLNAGETTNFIYSIEGYDFTTQEVTDINSIQTKSKIKDRLRAIVNRGADIEFFRVNKDMFRNNLVLIDSALPEILAEMVLKYYTSEFTSIEDLTKDLQRRNPLNYDTQHSHLYYEYKVKRLLSDTFLGMMPSKVWTGVVDATGGHLIVKESGDILCYHIYNRNQFEDYLYYNTRLESAGSTKHRYGVLIQDSSTHKFYIKLNLQIRFK